MTKRIDKSKWVWMPHAGHLIVSDRCNFRLNTYVGKYIVSTVGEFRESFKDKEFTTIGSDRLYETFVFKAKKSGLDCCLYILKYALEVDSLGCNNPKTAYENHLKLCKKWNQYFK